MACLILAVPSRAERRVTLGDAVRSTVARHPGVKIQEEQVNINRGLLQEAGAPFALQVSGALLQTRSVSPLTSRDQQAYVSDGLSAYSQALNTTDLIGTSTRQYRNGITFGLTSDTTRSADNLVDLFGINRSLTNFSIILPLMGGRGRTVVAAQETAAGIEVDASLLDLNQTIAQLIVNTVQSYWNAVSAKKLLVVANEAVERSNEFVENLNALIEADQQPRSDIYNFRANLADRMATRIAAEQALINGRKQLAIDMGLSTDDLNDLPDPVDDFPDESDLKPLSVSEEIVRQYTGQALRNRADVLAARRRMESARALVAGASDLRLPRLNASFSVGYAGLREGATPDRYLSSLLLGGRGLNVSGGLTYSLPNKALAHGRIVEAQAALRQTQLKTADVERSVAGSVLVAVSGVCNSVLKLKSAKESVRSFREALEGEREKLRLGVGSIVAILTVEDRLTSALNQLVQAQLAYPQALTDLRFATGSVLAPDRSFQTIDQTEFLRIPSPGETPGGAGAQERPK